jgi:hypothetical protein
LVGNRCRLSDTGSLIEPWLTERNAKPKPFKWTAKANIILEKPPIRIT